MRNIERNRERGRWRDIDIFIYAHLYEESHGVDGHVEATADEPDHAVCGVSIGTEGACNQCAHSTVEKGTKSTETKEAGNLPLQTRHTSKGPEAHTEHTDDSQGRSEGILKDHLVYQGDEDEACWHYC